MYLATHTRPEYAVSNVAKFSAKPTQDHWIAVKRILRYLKLKGTSNLDLLYQSRSKDCDGFSDADWGGDVNDHKSTSGYMFCIGGGAVTWKSKKQTCVALSTVEAEYIALENAAQEAVWMRRLLADLKNPPEKPTVIYEDNQSTICMTKNPQFHGRSKHIGIKYHYIREQVKERSI